MKNGNFEGEMPEHHHHVLEPAEIIQRPGEIQVNYEDVGVQFHGGPRDGEFVPHEDRGSQRLNNPSSRPSVGFGGTSWAGSTWEPKGPRPNWGPQPKDPRAN